MSFNEKVNPENDGLHDGNFDGSGRIIGKKSGSFAGHRNADCKPKNSDSRHKNSDTIKQLFDHEDNEIREMRNSKDIVSESELSSSASSQEEADFGNVDEKGERRQSNWSLPNQNLPEKGSSMLLRMSSLVGTRTTLPSTIQRNSNTSILGKKYSIGSNVRRSSHFSTASNPGQQDLRNEKEE